MEPTATPAKKFPWKFVLIALLVIAVAISTVVIVRNQKRKAMIKGLQMNGSTLTDDVLNSMSYSDIKKLYQATTGVQNP